MLKSCLFSLALLLSCFAAPCAQPSWPDPADPLAGMGVNIHFTRARPGELEMIQRAGFRWVRQDIYWADTEKKPGIYDFSTWDGLLNRLDKFQMRAVLILDYTNPLYDDNRPPDTEVGRAAFASWAVAAATHFKGRGVLWETWNEPNGNYGKPQPNVENYSKLAVAVGKAMQQALPDEQVIGPALAETHFDFLEAVGRAGAMPYWSGVTIHPYLPGGPENYGPAYEQTRQLIKKYGPDDRKIDVLCGESGYTIGPPDVDEPTQGKYLARLYLYDVMASVPLTIWYDWFDDGPDPKDAEQNFGTVRHAYHAPTSSTDDVFDPKPAYKAAKTYSGELTGFKFKERMKTKADDDYVLLFANDTAACFVAWTASKTPHRVSFAAPDGAYSVTGYDGTPLPELSTTDGALTLDLDGGPQYLKPR